MTTEHLVFMSFVITICINFENFFFFATYKFCTSDRQISHVFVFVITIFYTYYLLFVIRSTQNHTAGCFSCMVILVQEDNQAHVDLFLFCITQISFAVFAIFYGYHFLSPYCCCATTLHL